jgi:hypothetical protein
MTKGRVTLHPELVLVEKTADPSASLGMTKGRVTLHPELILVERTEIPHYAL